MRHNRWRGIEVVACAMTLAVPFLGAVPAQAAAVTVGSTIDLGWATTGSYGGDVDTVGGHWAAGQAQVATGGEHVFAADLSANPPAAVDLGTLGGTYGYASDISGSWLVGAAGAVPDPEQSETSHAFAVDLSAASPAMLDLNPPGMVWSAANAVDGRWAVGEIDASGDVNRWWGAAWDLTGATTATPPVPVRLLPQGTDPYAMADYVSGEWVVGESENASENPTGWLAWSLTGATTDTPVAPVPLPPLPGGEAYVAGVSGHRAFGSSTDLTSDVQTPVVWDLAQAAPTAVALPVTTGTSGWLEDGKGDLLVGAERTENYSQEYAVAWDVSSDPPTETVLPSLGGPAYEYSWATAVDGDWVVGTSCIGNANEFQERAFAYDLATGGPLLDLGTLGDYSNARDVDFPWVVGRSIADPNSFWRPTAWNLLTPAPPAVSAADPSDSAVSLAWSAPGYTAGSAVTGYEVAYRASGGAGWTTAVPTPATATSLTVGSLTNGVTYELKVRAATANGASAWSAVVTAVPRAAPAAPNAPVAKDGKAGMTVTWTDNGNGGVAITNHEVAVYRYTKATRSTPARYEWVKDVVTGSSGTSTTVTGLTKGTTYVFTVAASNTPAGHTTVWGTASPYSNAVKK